MQEQNKAVVRAWFEESDRRQELPADLCTPDFVGHYPGRPAIDLRAFQPHLQSFYAAFPDLTQSAEEIVAEGDLVGFRVISRGTHKGDFNGIAPTGKRIEVVQIGIARVTDGKVAEIWNNPDQLGMMQQLGVIPPPQRTEQPVVSG